MRSGAFIAPPRPDGDVVFSEAILWAGDLVAESFPLRMSTVLGSCVSVCLFDREHAFGGMNHYLVPRGGRQLIHGDHAIPQLVQRMERLGSSIDALRAKVFGGGSPLQLQNETLAIGTANVDIAHEMLASYGIPIVAERVGEAAGMRLFFENWTGQVWLKAHGQRQPTPALPAAPPAVARRPRLAVVTS